MKYENNKITINAPIYVKVSYLLISCLCTLVSGICLLTFMFCFLPTESQAAQIHSLNDLKVIEVPISQTGLTRITVKGDRISNVFGITGEYVMEPDEDQGQVFIRPLESAFNPISITLTTEGGHTQDLRLIPKHQAPAALILTAEGNSDTQKAAQDPISRNDIEDLLYACAKGRIPVGYRNIPLKIPGKDERYLLINEIKNGKLRALTYEVKNWATIPWILSESGFAQKLNIDVVAVLIPKKVLKPGERMHAYVAIRAL